MVCQKPEEHLKLSKPAHIRLIIKWFVYTGRYQATLRSQVESSSLFSFRTICNLLTGFRTRYTNLRRKYGRDTQCMWRYRYSLHVMDNVEELNNQKNQILRQKRRKTWYLLVSNKYWSRWNVVIAGIYAAKKPILILVRYRGSFRVSGTPTCKLARVQRVKHPTFSLQHVSSGLTTQ